MYMSFDYAKGILTFILGFIISFFMVSFFQDTMLGVMTAICYVGAIISGSNKVKDISTLRIS